MGSNQLTGRMPDALASLTKLQALHLGHNQLTGEVPAWLSGFWALTNLNLSGNQLSGELPAELDGLTELEDLRLDGNQLTGCVSDFLRDQVEAVYESIFSPGVPVCTPENHAGDTETLIALHRAWGEPEWENWLSREPIGEWQGVSVGFDGRVAGLTVISGRLPRGKTLNGKQLPPELGNLTGLRVLMLDGELTGELPAELGNLASLRAIGIGYNAGQYMSHHTVPYRGFTFGGCSPEANAYEGTILERVCESPPKLVSISIGGGHTCGVKTDDTVACWGRNNAGQSTPPEGEFASVSAGGSHTCGVKTGGAVACWGSNSEGQSTPLEGEFTSVSAGEDHTCGVKTDGTVACWGGNNAGASTPPEGEFASVSAGWYHTCGVKTDGTVACWGRNNEGQSTPPEGEFASVSAGEEYTCGVMTNGSLTCWGHEGWRGYAGYERNRLPEGQFVSLSVNTYTNCGVRTDGTAACDGYGWRNAVQPEEKFVSVSAGNGYACGLRDDGSFACWANEFDHSQEQYVTDFPRFQMVVASIGRLCVSGAGGYGECFDEPPPR